VTFNWDVSLGNVLTFLGMVVAFVVAHTRGVERLKEMETKVEMIYAWWVRHVQRDSGD